MKDDHGILIIIGVVLFVLGCSLRIFFRPVAYGSFIFWSGAALMTLPGLAVAEGLSSLGLGAEFVKKLSTPTRILFGIFWCLVCILFCYVILFFLKLLVVN